MIQSAHLDASGGEGLAKRLAKFGVLIRRAKADRGGRWAPAAAVAHTLALQLESPGMASRALNRNLGDARKAKQDEFYTQLSDIERELRHYRAHLKGKVVYCNCDDPRVSNFFHYFSYNFEKLGLKKLVATCYRSQQADLFRGSIRVPLTTSPSGDAQVGVHGRHFAILSISLRWPGPHHRVDT